MLVLVERVLHQQSQVHPLHMPVGAGQRRIVRVALLVLEVQAGAVLVQ
jgi:hypothetical protein